MQPRIRPTVQQRGSGRTGGHSGIVLLRQYIVARSECDRKSFTCGRRQGRGRNGSRSSSVLWPHRMRSARGLDHQIGHFKSEGTGRVKDIGRRKPHPGMPHRCIHQVNESSTIDVRQAYMRREPGRKTGTKLQIQGFQPERPAKTCFSGVTGFAAEQGVDGDLRSIGPACRRGIGSRTRHITDDLTQPYRYCASSHGYRRARRQNHWPTRRR